MLLVLRKKHGSLRIRSLRDELDEDDCAEIHDYFKSRIEVARYYPLPLGPREPTFDERRVFAAVYAQARMQKGDILPWSELPTRVAVDFFREFLSHLNFDQLYSRDAEGELGVDFLRMQLQNRMRNNGMLSYRLLLHRNECPLTPGEVYERRHLVVTPVQALQTPKVLRERGIQIIRSGFGELIPDNEVYRQLLAKWRADWELDTMNADAVSDLEARRIYSLTRAETQQEIMRTLSLSLGGAANSGTADAIRILQALETIAADGETRRLLPADTISVLGIIHSLLLPGDIGGMLPGSSVNRPTG